LRARRISSWASPQCDIAGHSSGVAFKNGRARPRPRSPPPSTWPRRPRRHRRRWPPADQSRPVRHAQPGAPIPDSQAPRTTVTQTTEVQPPPPARVSSLPAGPAGESCSHDRCGSRLSYRPWVVDAQVAGNGCRSNSAPQHSPAWHGVPAEWSHGREAGAVAVSPFGRWADSDPVRATQPDCPLPQTEAGADRHGRSDSANRVAQAARSVRQTSWPRPGALPSHPRRPSRSGVPAGECSEMTAEMPMSSVTFARAVSRTHPKSCSCPAQPGWSSSTPVRR